MDTPLSVVRMIFSWSLFNSWMAFASSLLMFGLGGWIFMRIDFVSPLSSSAFPCLSCWHILSICDMYSPDQWFLGDYCKIWDPWLELFVDLQWVGVLTVCVPLSGLRWLSTCYWCCGCFCVADLIYISVEGSCFSYIFFPVPFSTMLVVWAATCVSLPQSIKFLDLSL